ncbi:hypothetical protein [Streptomyces californicus]|uniref:hypothetical protein n=1 Tax=Streptomyces californicus TaxID=67351 RepID=UPI0012FE9DAD|nr:hypothetical protein [Streptomyces californicus]QRV59318.1 hypothetical protein I6J40_08320 [Streptomyces californicus]
MNTNPQPTSGGRQLGIDGLPAAPEAAPRTGRAVVGRKSSAECRPLRLVRPNSHPTTPTGPRQAVRWLHVVAPPSFSALVSARSWCRCGFERTARGRSGVLALIKAHTAHPESCPLLNPEGSKAA